MKKLNTNHKFDGRVYGTTVVGARGQVVIPVEARKDLSLKPGDRLMVVGRMNKIVGLIKPDQLSGLVQMIMEHVEQSRGPVAAKKFSKKAQEFLKQL